MSFMKAFLSEYEEMGNRFAYKDYKVIPKFIQEIVEEELQVDSFKDVDIRDINFILNDLYEEIAGANELTNIGVYDDE